MSWGEAFVVDHGERRDTIVSGRAEKENRMAYRAEASCVSIPRRSSASSRSHGRASTLIAVAGFALAGCNANQGINPSSQQNLADIYPNYNQYNPIQYAQSSGFYGGR
jgi:hypothetical protein